MLKIVSEKDVNIQKKRKYSKKELIEIIQEFVRVNNRLPTQKDFSNNLKYPSTIPYFNNFGNWNNGLIMAGYNPTDETFRGRQGEIQTLNEFKTNGALDLSGKYRKSSCDGICPKGELFDVKCASLIQRQNGNFCYIFNITDGQLRAATYLFLRAYEDKDFTKPPQYKWRIPIDLVEGRKQIVIYIDNIGRYNIKSMKEYEL